MALPGRERLFSDIRSNYVKPAVLMTRNSGKQSGDFVSSAEEALVITPLVIIIAIAACFALQEIAEYCTWKPPSR